MRQASGFMCARLSAVFACGLVRVAADGQEPDKGTKTFDTVWRGRTGSSPAIRRWRETARKCREYRMTALRTGAPTCARRSS